MWSSRLVSDLHGAHMQPQAVSGARASVLSGHNPPLQLRMPHALLRCLVDIVCLRRVCGMWQVPPVVQSRRSLRAGRPPSDSLLRQRDASPRSSAWGDLDEMPMMDLSTCPFLQSPAASRSLVVGLTRSLGPAPASPQLRPQPLPPPTLQDAEAMRDPSRNSVTGSGHLAPSADTAGTPPPTRGPSSEDLSKPSTPTPGPPGRRSVWAASKSCWDSSLSLLLPLPCTLRV